MDRYLLFRNLMDLVSDDYDVFDADLCNYVGSMEISGKDGGEIIRITVDFKEVNQDVD